jgi:hypothetical protein
MKTYSARLLLDYSTESLWEILTQDFILMFDDGPMEVNAKTTLYSSYTWDFHRMYPKTPLLKKHHLCDVLGNKRLGSDTHLELLGSVMWSVYDTYIALPGPLEAHLSKIGRNDEDIKISYTELTVVNEMQFRDHLSELIYQTTNRMYNDLSYRLEEYVVSLDITDFLELSNEPSIKHANETVESTQTSIDSVYSVVDEALANSSHLANNPLALAARSKLINIGQLRQCIAPRGYLTDTDSNLFNTPVLRGYFEGMRLFYDALIESRSAAKSLIFSKTPLQQAEYFSRRLQLMSQIVQHLHSGDCGSQNYLLWTVRGPKVENGELKQRGDLKQLVGKYYMDEDGKPKPIHADSTHLIGRTLKIRAAIHCAHPDPYGICSTCFGELSLSVPEDTNIGQMCCTSLAQKSSQNVLSVKHLDGSSVVDGIVLQQDERRYLKIAPDDNSYMLSDDLKGKKVKIVIRHEDAANITDIMQVKEVEELNITRVSELAEIGILVEGNDSKGVPVSLTVNLGRRLASMTYSMLKHIRATGWGVDKNDNYTIDMTEWDWSKSFLTLPLKHFNMSDHSRDIASMLESSVDKMKERDGNVSANAALIDLFDLVNDKLTVNLAVLDVVLYGSMIVSASEGDYSLPKPWTTQALGIMKLSMANRSLAPAMAYEQHQQVITDPVSYVETNRPDHPMDGILMPNEVYERGYKPWQPHRNTDSVI